MGVFCGVGEGFGVGRRVGEGKFSMLSNNEVCDLLQKNLAGLENVRTFALGFDSDTATKERRIRLVVQDICLSRRRSSVRL